MTEVTYYLRRNEYGGLKSDQVKRLKGLETENARLRKVSDLTLDKQILQEAARGNYWALRVAAPAWSMFVVSFASPSVAPVRRTTCAKSPEIVLATEATQPVAIVLHELVANAAK